MNLLDLYAPLFQCVCRLNRTGRLAGTADADAKGVNTMRAEIERLLQDISHTANQDGRDQVLRFELFINTTRAEIERLLQDISHTANQDGRLADLVLKLPINTTRAEIERLLQDISHTANQDGRLADQVLELDLPILFFIDSMIADSKLSYAADWNQHRMAFKRREPELAGDVRFFELLNATLNDASEDASERLAIFYTCLGLGFTGFYVAQPDELRRLMDRITPRVQPWMDNDTRAHICPEAYKHVNTTDMTEKPSRKLLLVGLFFFCFTVAVMFTYVWMFQHASQRMSDSIHAIIKHDSANR